MDRRAPAELCWPGISSTSLLCFFAYTFASPRRTDTPLARRGNPIRDPCRRVRQTTCRRAAGNSGRWCSRRILLSGEIARVIARCMIGLALGIERRVPGAPARDGARHASGIAHVSLVGPAKIARIGVGEELLTSLSCSFAERIWGSAARHAHLSPGRLIAKKERRQAACTRSRRSDPVRCTSARRRDGAAQSRIGFSFLVFSFSRYRVLFTEFGNAQTTRGIYAFRVMVAMSDLPRSSTPPGTGSLSLLPR